MLAHDLGLIGVEPAAEGDDLDIRHWRLLTRNYTISQTPHPDAAFGVVVPPHEGEGWSPWPPLRPHTSP
jgi:hypothetical protein